MTAVSGRALGAMAASQDNPSRQGLICYAAPIGAALFLWMPTTSILPGLYAKYFDLKLTAIATVLLVARVFDGLTDPAIGYLADRHRASGGSYKSWVVVGGAGLVVSGWYLFSPSRPVSQAYYLTWSLAFYVAWSLIDIPHAAWGSTLAGDYYGRARVYSYRTAAVFCGLTGFFAIPLLPLFQSNQYTPETMKWTVYVGAGAMFVGLMSTLAAPHGGAVPQRRDTARALLASVISNRPLLLFLAAYLVGGIGYGMWFGLVFVYLDSYLHLGDKIAAIFLIGNVIGMLSMPLWLGLTRASGKSATWATGTALFVALLAGCLFVGPSTPWWFSLLLTGGIYVSLACQTMAAQAILGDVTDYGELKFRANRGAMYFALLTFSNKVTSGVGAGIALATAGQFGFQVNALSQHTRGILGLRIAFIFLPLLCATSAIALILLTPITARRHRIIQRRLALRST